ncbi:MAG: hypothetical protein K8U57_37845 [Planctomycetes bacterium]|nr:hypothetical protein [Planctomycetota bacterium]
MIAKVFPLCVHVPRAGYRWDVIEDPTAIEGLAARLVRVPATGDMARFDTREPDVEQRTLFKSFTLIPDYDLDATLAFANAWGPLGSREVVMAEGPNALARTKHGEDYMDWWRVEIASLRHAVRVSDLLRDGDPNNELETLVRREELPNKSGQSRWLVRNSYELTGEGLDSFGERLRKASPDCPLSQSVFQGIGAKLTTLNWDEVKTSLPDNTPAAVVAEAWLDQVIGFTLDFQDLVRIQFGPDKSTKSRAFHVLPANLLGLLWLQFARAVALGIRTPLCQHCGKPFEVLAKSTTKKMFCSTVCKVREFRRRKSEGQPTEGA